jgi:type II secretory pathway pseudopilin PulG
MRFFRRLTDERGVALPVALAVLVTVAGLATVAARAAIVSQNQSFRDNNAKRAVQGANAGLQAAVYQTNLLQPSSTQCVHKAVSDGALSNGALQADTWCQPQTEDLGDGGSYTFQISSPSVVTTSTGLSADQRKVVSYGTVNGVRRRAVVTINAGRGAPIFPPGYAVAVRDSINMKNNGDISGHLSSNGTITVKNNLDICGNVTPGPGKTAKIGKNLDQCPGYNTTAAAEPLDLQPVDISRATPNDNVRLTNMKASPPVSPQDTCSSCNKIGWNSSTRVLTIENPGVLNLSGNVYLFCRLDFKSGTIQIPSRSTPLFIYIDSPENCGGTSGMGSVVMDGTWTNLYSPPQPIGIMVAGSPTMATSVDLPTNDANTPIGIYAPNSTVIQKNNVDFTGSVVSKTLDVKNNAKFTWHSAIDGLLSGSNIRFYQAATGSYKECTTAATGTAPDSGC